LEDVEADHFRQKKDQTILNVQDLTQSIAECFYFKSTLVIKCLMNIEKLYHPPFTE